MYLFPPQTRMKLFQIIKLVKYLKRIMKKEHRREGLKFGECVYCSVPGRLRYVNK